MTFHAYLAAVPATEFFWWSAVPSALAAAAFIATFAFVRRSRLMEDMPASPLRSVAQGYVEVEGTARVMPGPPIVCPLSATRSVWWRYRVEERKAEAGEGRKGWVTLDKGASDDCFLLDDGTGACVVDPAGADVVPTLTRRWYGNTPRPDVGYEHGRGAWRSLWCAYRYTEELILPGDPVYALGAYRTQSGAGESFDEQADLTELLAKWKHDKKMMALLDVNRDGMVDMKEWEAARRMGLAQVRRAQVQRAVATPDLNILANPRDGRPYILSGVPQSALIRRYKNYGAACLGGMVIMAGFVLWALKARGVIA